MDGGGHDTPGFVAAVRVRGEDGCLIRPLWHLVIIAVASWPHAREISARYRASPTRWISPCGATPEEEVCPERKAVARTFATAAWSPCLCCCDAPSF